MTTNACKFICLIFLFAFVSQGFGCQGSFEDIYLKQSKTGKMIKNTPEWEVRVTNPCTCTCTDIVLTCVGFKSLTPIDRLQLSISGNECKMTNNLYGHSDFVFKYVWAKKLDIKMESGGIACS
ncbi:hypothetical protein BRARA_A00576 [Brassica rapa]|uniref:Uncharacterized protein n=2 Tax=Brassica TaxID=3705 RepID=A0A398AL33_BRACM|nr:uncharacterized protein LOC125609236 [Brassica napus]KAH0940916.1 hypothetical protein HID58_000553 [Brassica napus]RID77688.1 hypothetical protein BRARA_A00576 [Brassica rapa]CAF2147489.1 unnamed protein product [Brassica napus]